jgi:UDP-N-acetylmuramate dehydrogenase
MVKMPAAWLIEREGFPRGFTTGRARISRGFTMGRARISRENALALVNDGASTRELLDLARAIRRGVSDAFGVTLPAPLQATRMLARTKHDHVIAWSMSPPCWGY